MFEPGRELQALGCLELMEFDGKDALMGRIAASAELHEQLEQLRTYKALALALARRYRPDLAAGLLGEAPAMSPAAPEAENEDEALLDQSQALNPRPDRAAAAAAAQAPVL